MFVLPAFKRYSILHRALAREVHVHVFVRRPFPTDFERHRAANSRCHSVQYVEKRKHSVWNDAFWKVEDVTCRFHWWIRKQWIMNNFVEFHWLQSFLEYVSDIKLFWCNRKRSILEYASWFYSFLSLISSSKPALFIVTSSGETERRTTLFKI